MAIQYKGKDNRYEYETHNKWNKDKKKYETKWKYLGKVDPVTKIVTPKHISTETLGEKLIVDYGNTFALNEYCRLSGFTSLIMSVFGKQTNTLLALVCYRLIESDGMNMVQERYDGNYAQIGFPDLDLSSQHLKQLRAVFFTVSAFYT